MASTNLALKPDVLTKHTFTIRELAFIAAYMANGGNAAQAVREAGYKSRAPEKYG